VAIDKWHRKIFTKGDLVHYVTQVTAPNRNHAARFTAVSTPLTATLHLFVGHEIRATNIILTSYFLFGCSREAVEETTRSGVPETSPVQRFDQFCDPQSAGDSPRPQVDVIPHRLR